MRNHFLTPLTEHVYKEELPSVNPMVEESDRLAASTMARIESMRLAGLMQGQRILKSDRKKALYDDTQFIEPYRESKKDLPKIKVSELQSLNREK